MFVAATPQSELRNKMQKKVDKTKFKIKVIEKSGKKLIRHLQRNDPFKKKECRNNDECMICSGSDPGACRDTGVSYKISCSSRLVDDQGRGKYEYTGQTGKNGYTRGKKHIDDYVHKRDSSALWKHCLQKHNGEQQHFEMKVVDRCRNDPTKRQTLEALRIQKVPKECVMNGKSEWNTTRIPRIRVTEEN